MKITEQDFAAAAAAVKNHGTADSSAAHRIAIAVLTARCPLADASLINDLAWQVYMCTR